MIFFCLKPHISTPSLLSRNESKNRNRAAFSRSVFFHVKAATAEASLSLEGYDSSWTKFAFSIVKNQARMIVYPPAFQV